MIFLQQGYTNYGRQVAWATKFCIVTHDVCGSTLRILFYVTFMVPRILRLLVDFLKICAPLSKAALLHDKVHHFATVSKFRLPLNYQCLDTPYVQILILIFTCLLCSTWITN
jgi:hypothetical protein